jgi:hypothetical protein
MDEAARLREEAGHRAPDRPPARASGEAARMREAADRFFWSWLRFWVQLAVLAVLAIAGLFYASGSLQPGAYQSGVMLAVAALALALLLVKRRLDGGPGDLAGMLLVDDLRALAFVIPLFTIAALCGLLIAAAFPLGPRYLFGLGLFGASVLAILWQIKHVFDRSDRGGR